MATTRTSSSEVVSTPQRLVPAGKRFLGRFPGKIDSKGRLSIPADLRRAIDSVDGHGAAGEEAMPKQLYVFANLEGPGLWCGGPDLPDGINDILRELDPMDDEIATDADDETWEGIRTLAIDDTGRITLPQDLREEAGLVSAVTFGGRGWCFLLGDADAMEEARKARQAALKEKRAAIRQRRNNNYVSRKGGALG